MPYEVNVSTSESRKRKSKVAEPRAEQPAVVEQAVPSAPPPPPPESATLSMAEVGINSEMFARLVAEVHAPPSVPDDAIAAFVKAVYDGVPFTYVYELAPGIRLTFRELRVTDLQLCRSETTIPFETCEMLASIAGYHNEHTGVSHELSSVCEMDYDKTQHSTPLPELLQWVSNNILPAVGVFEMAQKKYAEFKLLLTLLYSDAPRFFARAQPVTH